MGARAIAQASHLTIVLLVLFGHVACVNVKEAQSSTNANSEEVSALSDNPSADHGNLMRREGTNSKHVSKEIPRTPNTELAEEKEIQNGKDASASGGAGPRGPTGHRGARGWTGHRGARGSPGPRGGAGSRGPTGPPGRNGARGGGGTLGRPGNRGAAGARGPTGVKGARGDIGAHAPIRAMVNCKWNSWLEWEPCPKSCGGSKHQRQRTVSVYPRDGGKGCVGIALAMQACGKKPCPTTTTTTTATTVPIKAGSPMRNHGAPFFAVLTAVVAYFSFLPVSAELAFQ